MGVIEKKEEVKKKEEGKFEAKKNKKEDITYSVIYVLLIKYYLYCMSSGSPHQNSQK